MLTACGIETTQDKLQSLTQKCRQVATVLTACGIETVQRDLRSHRKSWSVATVLTACGIETIDIKRYQEPLKLASCNSAYRLRY